MCRALRPAFLLTALLLVTVPVAADPPPFLQGVIQGLELCPKEICTVAVFVGEFDGEVNGLSRHGVFLAGIDHELPLPVVTNDTADITGGAFVIRLPFRTIRGVVDNVGGTLKKNEDETFEVVMPLHVAGPNGLVAATFVGTLSHEVFPPTIVGTIGGPID
jgi:hypothetical protein